MAVTLTLGGIALDPNLIWPERRQSQRVAMSVQRTLGGGAVIRQTARQSGLPITLQSGPDHGFLKTPAVEALKIMADVAGATYTLEVADGTDTEEYLVSFRSNERPAFEAVPLVQRLFPKPGDFFRVTIKLLTA